MTMISQLALGTISKYVSNNAGNAEFFKPIKGNNPSHANELRTTMEIYLLHYVVPISGSMFLYVYMPYLAIIQKYKPVIVCNCTKWNEL